MLVACSSQEDTIFFWMGAEERGIPVILTTPSQSGATVTGRKRERVSLGSHATDSLYFHWGFIYFPEYMLLHLLKALTAISRNFKWHLKNIIFTSMCVYWGTGPQNPSDCQFRYETPVCFLFKYCSLFSFLSSPLLSNLCI